MCILSLVILVFSKSKLCTLILFMFCFVLKNKQNGETDKKSEKKNQKNGGSVDKTDKKNQCKEIVLKVYMHCEGCASQVSHCLRGYHGNIQFKKTLLVYFSFFKGIISSQSN